MVPTSGGSSTGRPASAPSKRRPGKSYRPNKKASGTPIKAESTTETSEIQTLFQSASSSERLLKKRA